VEAISVTQVERSFIAEDDLSTDGAGGVILTSIQSQQFLN